MGEAKVGTLNNGEVRIKEAAGKERRAMYCGHCKEQQRQSRDRKGSHNAKQWEENRQVGATEIEEDGGTV